MITVKVYRRGEETVVAACDKELMGNTYREGELRIKVSRAFYEGEDASEEMLVRRLEMATIANLVGERTIEVAIRHKYVERACVLYIDGIPHAQMVRI